MYSVRATKSIDLLKKFALKQKVKVRLNHSVWFFKLRIVANVWQDSKRRIEHQTMVGFCEHWLWVDRILGSVDAVQRHWRVARYANPPVFEGDTFVDVGKKG